MTKEQVIERAKHFGLEAEVRESLALGMTPEEALYEWDLLQFHTLVNKSIVSRL